MEAVKIKGTRDGLVILINSDKEFEEVKSNLISKMESSRGFFQGAKFTFHSKQPVPRNISRELENICLLYGLVPSVEIKWPAPGNNINSPALWSPGEKKEHKDRRSSNIIPFKNNDALPTEQCIMINKTLRSGSRVESRSSVVVMGDVNPGAQVAAGGSIIILGSCYGDIRAGQNDLSALVLADKLKPTFLSIGPHMADATTVNCSNVGPWLVKLLNGCLKITKQG